MAAGIHKNQTTKNVTTQKMNRYTCFANGRPPTLVSVLMKLAQTPTPRPNRTNVKAKITAACARFAKFA